MRRFVVCLMTLAFSLQLVMLFSAAALADPVVWTGPKITFTKADFADWTQEANQDRITENVWITRADSEGIYNIKTEFTYSHYSSPADTEWAYGSAANWQSLTFQDWEHWHGNNPPITVGQNAVLHLISDDIYIDIKFLSWTSGGAGGGFSYERSTPGQQAINVDIDIKPGSYPNSINLGSNGKVPVAIFGSADFDVTTIDFYSVTLAGASVVLKGKAQTPMVSIEDLNADGFNDLIIHVDTEALELSTHDTIAILEGKTDDDTPITGEDSVRIVPYEEAVCPCQGGFDTIIANYLQDINTCWNNNNTDVGISNGVGGPAGLYATANTGTLTCTYQWPGINGGTNYGTQAEIQKCIDTLVTVIAEDPTVCY
ncbi:MAG: hypothetical protein ACMUIU_19015 [bacterium]